MDNWFDILLLFKMLACGSSEPGLETYENDATPATLFLVDKIWTMKSSFANNTSDWKFSPPCCVWQQKLCLNFDTLLVQLVGLVQGLDNEEQFGSTTLQTRNLVLNVVCHHTNCVQTSATLLVQLVHLVHWVSIMKNSLAAHNTSNKKFSPQYCW
jgi:cytosine/uracil/thiamine/allantoin permease